MGATSVQTQANDSPRTASPQRVGSPTKALQNIVNKKLSGRLTVRDPHDHSVFWRVYFGNGNVHFANSVMGHKERLAYHLSCSYPTLEQFSSEPVKSDYQVICDYWKAGQLSLQQTRELLFKLTQEALVQLINLPQAELQFEKTVGLDPILLSVSLKQTLLPMRSFIGQWGKLRPEIGSPFQRPFIKDLEQLPKLIWHNVKDIQFIKSLVKVLNKNLCIYEAASQLQTDALALATLLQPLVREGAIGVNPYEPPQHKPYRPLVACIDDSKTTQRHLKAILEASGYRYLGLTEPAKALTTLARYKPALVLMDINMPEMNGYELSRMLRHSSLLEEIPIVMLTGRDGIIDKMRGRMVGANDYLTKPCKAQELLTVIEEQLSVKTTQSRQPVVASELAYSC